MAYLWSCDAHRSPFPCLVDFPNKSLSTSRIFSPHSHVKINEGEPLFEIYIMNSHVGKHECVYFLILESILCWSCINYFDVKIMCGSF